MIKDVSRANTAIFVLIMIQALHGMTGCTARKPAPSSEGPADTPVERGDPVDIPVDHPQMDPLAVLSRGPRRMSVEQLERSLEIIGHLNPGDIVIPPDLAFTLGRPDYLRVTEESLEPTPLFMKFMMDLGGFFCSALADAEATRPIEDRVFTRHGSRNDNLSTMLLAFTGIDGVDAEPYIERLTRVHDAARSGPRADLSGYEAVCLALFTSPEFLLY